ncbi:retention module-containing protein [Geomonas agri]|uniref:retention module-containing protein n=1 Tax=Geomonas agri TaxID=2873702 RepID=UPI001CD7E19A|nr:retention module-containing protein [Geomonas agri]
MAQNNQAAGHQVVGKVVILYGTVKAISPDGAVRLLMPNSPIFADDRIVTESDGSASIVFDGAQGNQLDLGRMMNVTIDHDVYGTVMSGDTTDTTAEVAQIQQALLTGDQPIELEAPAAGGPADAGGTHPVFIVTPTGEEVLPTGGVTTTGVTFGTTGTLDSVITTVPTPPLTATITVNPITSDNIVNNVEATGQIPVSGTVGGDAHPGDTVTIVINGNTHTGTVAGDNSYIINVPGSELVNNPNQVITVSVTTTGPNGNTATAVVTPTYTVDTTTADIHITSIAGDNIVNNVEAGNANVPVTGTFGGGVHAGDVITLTVGGQTYSHTVTDADVSSHSFIVNVSGADLTNNAGHAITASVSTTDVAGSTASASDTAGYTVDNTTAEISITSIAGDNIVNNAEAGSTTVPVTGTIGGGVHAGDVIILTIGEHTYTHTVTDADAGSHSFTVNVPGSDLTGNAGHQVTASVTTTDAAGSTASASAVGEYTVDSTVETHVDTAHSVGSVDEGALAGGSHPGTGYIAEGSLVSSGGTGSYTYALVSDSVAHEGTLVIDPATGHYTYTLNGPTLTNSPDTFTYQVTDAHGNTATNTVTITIADDAPIANADSGSVVEGAILSGSVVGNDIPGADGSVVVVGVAAGVSATAVSGQVDSVITGAHGTLTLHADGSYDYHANPNSENTSDTFTYTIQDADGSKSTSTLTVNLTDSGLHTQLDTLTSVTGVDEGALPVGSHPGSGYIAEGNLISTGGAGPYSYALVSDSVAHEGTLVIDPATGHYTYTLSGPTGTNTPDSFTYQVTDAYGNTATNTVTITVADDAPVANVDSGSVMEGATVAGSVVTNDVPGADGVAPGSIVVVGVAAGVSATAVSGQVDSVITGAHGTLTLHADGSYDYHANPNSANTSDTFTYTIQDADGSKSTSTLTVNLTDSGLHTQLDTLTSVTGVDEGALPVGSHPGNGYIAEGNLVSTGGAGSYTYALVSDSAAHEGTLAIDPATGHYTYTLSGPTGTNAPDTFTYQVTDSNGNTSTNTVTITIADDAPVANVDSGSVVEGASVSGSVVANDVPGADGVAPGSIVVVGVAAGTSATAVSGQVDSVITGAHGTLTLHADGSYDYHANANSANTSDTFTYTIQDADGSKSTSTLTVNLTDSGLHTHVDTLTSVTSVDEGALPVGSHPGSGYIAEGNLVSTGGAGSYTYALVSDSATHEGTLVIDPAGHYTYTLNGPTLTNSPDTFTYQVTDGEGNTSTNTVTITITDDAPVAQIDSGSVVEGATLSGSVVTNDIPGADGSIVVVGAAAGVSATAVAGQVNSVITGAHGTLTLHADGSYDYHANPNSDNTSDTFTYTIQDADGSKSTSTLTINLTDSGLHTQVDTVHSDTSVDEGALSVGSHPGSGYIAEGNLISSGGAGSYSYALVSDSATHEGTLVIDANGHYTYTLNGPTLTNSPDTFTYQVTDAHGNTATNTVTITIADDAPVAHTDSGSVMEGATLSGNVVANDVPGADGVAPGSIVVVGVAAGVSATAVSGQVDSVITGAHGTLTLHADGSYDYHANPNSDNTSDTFTYTIQDADGSKSTSTLTVNLTDSGLHTQVDTVHSDTSVDEGALPVGSHPGTGYIAEGTLVSTGGAGSYSYALVSDSATHEGTLVIDANGHYTYTLNGPTLTNSPDTFTYQVTDAYGNTATNTVTIAIADDAPVANTDTGSVVEGATLSGSVVTNDIPGADGSIVVVGAAAGTSATAVSGQVDSVITGAHGTLTLHANGSYEYHANPNSENTSDTFTYTIQDADGSKSTSTLTVNLTDSGLHTQVDTLTSVTSVDEGALPVGSHPGSGYIAEGNLVSTGGAGSYSYALVSDSATHEGTLVIDADGHYTYTLNGPTLTNSPDTFTYQVTDANGNIATNTVTITIADDAPVANVDSGSVVEGAALSGSVVTNDIPGADGSIVVVGAAAGASATAVSGQVDSVITGAHGTLTLHANGSYEYHANPNSANTSDTFTYTIQDADGSKSTSTLTINLTNSGLHTQVDTVHSDTTVDEGALSVGTHPGTGYIAEGTLISSGGDGSYTYALVPDSATHEGTLVIDPSTGHYTYTLSGPSSSDSPDTFTFQVTDGHGNTATNTLTVTITDDAPVLNVTNGIFQNTGDTDTTAHTGGTIVEGTLATIGADLNNAHVTLTGTPPSGLTSYGQAVTYSVSTDGSTIHATADGHEVFTLTAHSDGTYTFDQHQMLDLAVLNSNLQGSIGAGGPQTAFYVYTDGSSGFDATAKPWSLQITADGHSVNPSTQGMGVDNNWLNLTSNAGTTETLHFNFDNEGASGAANFAYQAKIGINDLGAGEKIVWDATYTDGAGHTYTDHGEATTSSLDSTGHLVFTAPQNNMYIDHIDFTGGAGAVRVTSFTAYTIDTNVTQTLNFGFTATDGDGDHVSGNFSLLAQNGSTLTGDSSNNALGGGHGDNVMSGGAGADIFTVNGGNDTIKDFTAHVDKIVIEQTHTDGLFQHTDGSNTATLTITNNGTQVGTVTFENVTDAGALLDSLIHNDPKIHS